MLKMKGTRMPTRMGVMRMFGDNLTRVKMNGIQVWEVYKVRHVYDTTSTFTVPTNITEVMLCGGGGGGGGATDSNLGGEAGALVSNFKMAVTPGDVLDVVIGAGGVAGANGGETSFHTLSVAGGLAGAHAGDGARRVSCGGTYYDGQAISGDFGGQAGIRGNGGDAHAPGEGGSGGGANASGGKGWLIVTYYKEEL